MDAMEGRTVSIADIPGAYLHAELPPGKNVLLKLTDDFVDIMCEVNHEFLPHVRYEGKTKILYVHVLRASYGYLESAMLWYDLYWITLEKMGFTLNPYDLCLANKEINDTMCTIFF